MRFRLSLSTVLLMLAATSAQAKVVLNVNEWPGYVSMNKEEFYKYAKSKGIEVELNVVKPDIATEEIMFNNLRSTDKAVDIATPTESFLPSRQGKILKLLAPVDPSKVDGYNNVPAQLRNSEFHISGGKHYGIVFMAGYYGLYYNSNVVKSAPTSWEILWSPEAAKKYSVSKDTYFVNAHIAQWTIDSKNIEHAYDETKMDDAKLRSKLKDLAKNAAHLWEGIGNTPEQLKDLHYTASWGFELPKEWKLARPAPGSPTWIDCLSITEKAAKDPKKLEAFYALASFLVRPETQEVYAQKLRAIPLTGKTDASAFDKKFYWHPLSDRAGNFMMNAWEAAKK